MPFYFLQYQLGHNPMLLGAFCTTILSIAFFNFAGISVTKEMSATTRYIFDTKVIAVLRILGVVSDLVLDQAHLILPPLIDLLIWIAQGKLESREITKVGKKAWHQLMFDKIIGSLSWQDCSSWENSVLVMHSLGLDIISANLAHSCPLLFQDGAGLHQDVGHLDGVTGCRLAGLPRPAASRIRLAGLRNVRLQRHPYR